MGYTLGGRAAEFRELFGRDPAPPYGYGWKRFCLWLLQEHWTELSEWQTGFASNMANWSGEVRPRQRDCLLRLGERFGWHPPPSVWDETASARPRPAARPRHLNLNGGIGMFFDEGKLVIVRG